MKFKFRLETVLGHRRSLEELAQIDFQAAQARLRGAMQVVEQLSGQKKLSRERLCTVQTKGGLITPEAQSIAQFLTGQDILILRARKTVQDLEMEAEQKRMLLVEAAKGVKILERLREKNVIEFKKEQTQKETKMLDDMVVMRNARNNRE